jgi:hypothetical protein
MACVATLTLGSQPKQGVARLWAKRKIRESHHMLPKVQKVWGNEPSHSQVNSNCRSWNPKWILKSSKHDCKGQNSLAWRVIYIIGKLLKLRCLKWARITHLDIWNIIYDQNQGRESNWQFDSWPLKVKNQPNFITFKWCAIYCWKTLDKGYNFSLDLIAIGGLHTKLCAPKVAGIPIVKISGPETKSHLDVAPWREIEYTIRGKVMDSPKFGPWWILWVWSYPWVILAPKVLQLCTNHLVLVLCRGVQVVMLSS